MSQPFYEPGSAAPGLVRAEPGARLYQPPRFGPTADAAAPGAGLRWPSASPWSPGYGPAPGCGGPPGGERHGGRRLRAVLPGRRARAGLQPDRVAPQPGAGPRRARSRRRRGRDLDGQPAAGRPAGRDRAPACSAPATGSRAVSPARPRPPPPAVPVAPRRCAGASPRGRGPGPHRPAVGPGRPRAASGDAEKIGVLADTVQQQGAAAGDSGSRRTTARLADAFRAALGTARTGTAPRRHGAAAGPRAGRLRLRQVGVSG